MIDFWKSMTASHILAGARQVARRVTEGRPRHEVPIKKMVLYCKPILRALSLLVCGL